jgi:hypothetical protein
MSFDPTFFRPFCREGWGGKAASNFRGLLSTGSNSSGLASAFPQVLGINWRNQVGTFVQRRFGAAINTALIGVTRDSSGAVLGNCVVELYQGKKMIAGTNSDVSGNYRFDNPGSGPFRIISDKAGVAGVTAETLVAT